MGTFTIYGYDTEKMLADAVMVVGRGLEQAIAKAATKWPDRVTGAVVSGQKLPIDFLEVAENAKALRAINLAARPLTYHQKCANHIQAAKNKGLDNVIRSLPTTLGCEKTIEKVAEKIESKKQ
jgi:hypothetical protein